jgi:hypothetical protein
MLGHDPANPKRSDTRRPDSNVARARAAFAGIDSYRACVAERYFECNRQPARPAAALKPDGTGVGS